MPRTTRSVRFTDCRDRSFLRWLRLLVPACNLFRPTARTLPVSRPTPYDDELQRSPSTMSSSNTILQDLYAYNTWANRRAFALCDGLTDEQLDQPREMGFGSLRNTLFHILSAEEIWLERWQAKPWRAFDVDAGGRSPAEIASRLEKVAVERAALMEREQADGWSRICKYKDGKGNPVRNRLDDSLWHVANHGIHHRAQALNYLKQFGRTAPGGLDYIFFRLAYPTVKQDPAVADGFRGFGLEIDTGPGQDLIWNTNLIRRFFAYADWANGRLLELTEPLEDEALDRPWEMGMGSVRKTVTHILDVERWWLRNWTEGPTVFDTLPETTKVAEARDEWTRVIEQRTRFLSNLNAAGAARVVTALIGEASVNVGVNESLLQLCGHGTHHRAQWINMLRCSQASPPSVDVLVWVRQQA